MYMLRWFVVFPLLSKAEMSLQLSHLDFFLLVFATVCITASGYVINDYFDRKADLVNRPGRVILGRILSRRTGILWHIVLTSVGIIAGIYVAYTIGHLKFGAIFILVSGILWFYSTSYKRQVLLGNAVVALLVAMVPFLLLIFEMPSLMRNYTYMQVVSSPEVLLIIKWIVGYAIFAFLLTFIREIVKDLEDIEGDSSCGRQTVPIAWGINVTRYIIFFLGFITVGFVVVLLAKLIKNPINVAYGTIALLLPLLFFLYTFKKSTTKKDYHKVSSLLKLIMLSGILYAVVATIWLF